MEFAKGAKVPQGSVLILPDDTFVSKVEAYLSSQVHRLKTFEAWSDFVNYVTFDAPELYDQKGGRYTSLGGLKININFEKMLLKDVTANATLRVLQIIETSGIKIITISGILIAPEIKDRFVASQWSLLGRDVFLTIASQANPRDVVRLCGLNQKLRGWCDETFYANMLRVHFNRKSEKPKEEFSALTGPQVWGTGANNYKQLDLGDVRRVNIPTHITFVTNIKAIEAGVLMSLFLDREGRIAHTGRLPDAQASSKATKATRVNPFDDPDDFPKIVQISGVNRHCLALDEDGRVWGFGPNDENEIESGDRGLGGKYFRMIEGISNVISVCASRGVSLFLTENRQVWARGSNITGQLGLGRDLKRAKRLTLIKELRNVKAMSSSGGHSLFLDYNGNVWSCGSNDYGQLGTGGLANRYKPWKVEGLNNVEAVSVGYDHSLFLDRDGQVWGCGNNYNGQLGLGDFGNRDIPTKIESLQNVIAISAAGKHSLFLDKDGKVWACGYNNEGQLGLGDEQNRDTPTRIETLDKVLAISAGNTHSLFIV